MASQAIDNKNKPINQRKVCGHKTQAATPRRIIHAPSNTQPAPASNHMTGGVAATQPARSAKPHNARASKAPVQDHNGPMAFKRPHSHAPAAIISTVKAMKGQGLAANRAGSNKAKRTSAVMTLCLSMRSPEKKAAKGAAIQAVASHGIVCRLRPP